MPIHRLAIHPRTQEHSGGTLLKGDLPRDRDTDAGGEGGMPDF